LLGACTPIPPPKILSEIDQVSEAPAVREAKADAAAAIAHAEALRRRAHAALADGDFAGAQIIGEQAMAAYQTAVAVARVSAAERVKVASLSDTAGADEQLAGLDVEHQRLAADISALEKRLRALRDTESPRPSGPARPEREKARGEAVAALQMQARLLCTAARLLTRSQDKTALPAELGEATTALAALEKLLDSGPAAAPIDQATRVRAACLAALTKVRRANNNSKVATGGADALLSKLSKLGLGAPRRDERGVAVSLRALFSGEKLTADGKKTLAQLATVAKAHHRFPMMVVLHAKSESNPKQLAQQRARGRAVVAAFEKVLGAGRLGKAQLAGAAQPLVARDGKYAHRNERVEIVFVAPQAL